MKKVLVVDNQDSFVYNLVEMLRVQDIPFEVKRCEDLRFPLHREDFAGLLLSPGGGLPQDYPQMMQLIERYHTEFPILGVCLGHQAIGQYFGATLQQLSRPLHGHASELRITLSHDTLVSNVSTDSAIGRYHSWVIDADTLPATLQAIALDEDDNIMIMRHVDYLVWGVQFHPESVITDECGKMILNNWLAVCKF